MQSVSEVVHQSTFERLAQRAFPIGAVARCAICLEEQFLTTAEIVDCLGDGWPHCCGRQMVIEGSMLD